MSTNLSTCFWTLFPKLIRKPLLLFLMIDWKFSRMTTHHFLNFEFSLLQSVYSTIVHSLYLDYSLSRTFPYVLWSSCHLKSWYVKLLVISNWFFVHWGTNCRYFKPFEEIPKSFGFIFDFWRVYCFEEK